jgi:hypothetical protein
MEGRRGVADAIAIVKRATETTEQLSQLMYAGCVFIAYEILRDLSGHEKKEKIIKIAKSASTKSNTCKYSFLRKGIFSHVERLRGENSNPA